MLRTMLESASRCGIRTQTHTRPDERIAAAATDCWGVFSLHELCAHGLSKYGVLRRERSGALVRVYRGVYVLGFLADAPEARAIAAVKAAGRGAVLSHRAAGWLWGFCEGDEPRPEITVPSPRAPRTPELVLHRAQLAPADLTRHRGVPITNAARTIVDLASVLPEGLLRQAVRRAQGHRRLSLPSLLRALERLGPRRGSATLRRIIATGPAPTRSALEDVVLDLLIAAGFEHPDVNKPLIVSGRRTVPDFRWPSERLILEADGAGWHDQVIDAERQELLEAHGERVLRLSWNDAVRQPQATLARVAASGVPRAR